MLVIKKILFPVEFHEKSLEIVRLAAGIARRFHAGIILFHAVEPDSERDWTNGRLVKSGDLLAEFTNYAENELHEAVQPELEGLTVQCVVRQGDGATEIVRTAEDQSVDLIVMPTRGYKGPYRRLIGSVTAEVMHDTDRPVLTAAHLEGAIPKEGDISLKHVLCGVTFNDHSRHVLTCAAKVAAEFGAKLTIAHVAPDAEMYGPGGDYVDRGWKEEFERSALELMSRIQKQVGVTGDTAVDTGEVGIALSRIAQRIGADLLVVGCHNSGGHLGSNGYGILSESLVPVLSI